MGWPNDYENTDLDLDEDDFNDDINEDTDEDEDRDNPDRRDTTVRQDIDSMGQHNRESEPLNSDDNDFDPDFDLGDDDE